MTTYKPIGYDLDIIPFIQLIAGMIPEETQHVLCTAVAEIKRLREIEETIRNANQATTKEEKATTWQKLLNLVQ